MLQSILDLPCSVCGVVVSVWCVRFRILSRRVLISLIVWKERLVILILLLNKGDIHKTASVLLNLFTICCADGKKAYWVCGWMRECFGTGTI